MAGDCPLGVLALRLWARTRRPRPCRQPTINMDVTHGLMLVVLALVLIGEVLAITLALRRWRNRVTAARWNRQLIPRHDGSVLITANALEVAALALTNVANNVHVSSAFTFASLGAALVFSLAGLFVVLRAIWPRTTARSTPEHESAGASSVDHDF